MKLLAVAILYSSLFVVLLGMTSCNRYIDKTTTERKIPIMQGSLTLYPDSNVFTYRSSILLKADNEVKTPKPFYVRVPKGLKWYGVENSQAFSFYYESGQVISIVIDLADNVVEKDSTFQPTKAEIEKYRIAFTAVANQKYNMWNIGYDQKRKQLLVKKGAATILLYNILPRNYDQFRSFIEGFKFK